MTGELKSYVSVSEMARMVGLSRQRFHQLMTEGVFPPPLYDIQTRRPFYTEELQAVCLKVRQQNFGINGRPVLFYARRPVAVGKAQTRQNGSASPKATPKHAHLIDGLKGLGMVGVIESQVETALAALYPNGRPEDQGEVLRTVFVHLMRRDTGEKVGRKE